MVSVSPGNGPLYLPPPGVRPLERATVPETTAESPPGEAAPPLEMPDTQHVAKLLELEKRLSGEVEASSEWVEGALVASESLNLTAESAVKILELCERLPESISTLHSLERVVPGFENASHVLADLGFVISVAGLVVAARQYNTLQGEITALQQEIDQSQDPSKLEDLRRRMAELEQKKTALLNGVVQGVVLSGLSAAKGSVAWAETGAHAASSVAHLGLAVQSLGLAAGAVTAGYSTYQLTQDIQEHSALDVECRRLTEQLKDPNIDPAVALLIEWRVKHLVSKMEDNTQRTLKNTVAIYSSAMTMVGAAGHIAILAGATVGATATVALSATGIGGVAIGVGLLVGALGYAAYKNREAIQLNLRDSSLAMQQRLSTWDPSGRMRAIEQAESELRTLTQELRVQRSQVQQDAIAQLNVERDAILAKIERQSRQNIISQTMSSVFDRSMGDLRQDLRVHFESREGRIQQELARFDEQARQKVAEAAERLDTLTSKVSVESQALSRARQETQERLALVKLSKRFSDVKPEEVREIAGQFQQVLVTDPNARQELRTFLGAEKADISAFDTDPIGTVLSYLTQPLEQKAA